VANTTIIANARLLKIEIRIAKSFIVSGLFLIEKSSVE